MLSTAISAGSVVFIQSAESPILYTGRNFILCFSCFVKTRYDGDHQIEVSDAELNIGSCRYSNHSKVKPASAVVTLAIVVAVWFGPDIELLTNALL